MSLALGQQTAPTTAPVVVPVQAGRVSRTWGYLKRNRSLLVGLGLLGALALFVVIGHLTVDVGDAAPMSAGSLDSPSRALPFGSDKQGRNLYAVMVEGTPLTLRLGLIAGVVGLVVGALVGFVAGYYGGPVDAVLRVIIDVGLTIPALLILVVLAMRNSSGMTVNQMTFAISCLAWLYPARIVRAQVMTLKERGYVQIAKLSGMTGREVIYKELLPNLLPYLVAGLVGSISAAVLAAIGLEMLGLGPFEAPTLGMTLYWVNYNAAIINGWWWWWVPPIVIIAVLFTGLFLTAVGLDELANPRLRNRV
ncbi:MAG TPA: ABC transporter permease [Thermomicrobiales bacterium]|nr:ABC transporter permease [Thermomicrobiales bacterium]